MRILFITFTLIISFLSHSKDITQAVLNNTDLDKKISDACSSGCGNKGESKLKKVQAFKKNNYLYNIILLAYVKFHHHVDMLIGGGFALYEVGVNLKAEGELDKRNCKVTIISISYDKDYKDILKKASKGEVGKVHDIKNCQKLL